jgi:Zn-dependent M28 family amino/carboxypeptidase
MRLCALLSPLFSIVPFLCVAPAVAKSPINWEIIRENTRILSSDAFEGRAPASAGEDKTIAHLIAQFEAAGLKPGNKGSWTQDVPVVEIETDPSATLNIRSTNSKTAALKLAYGKDVVVWTKRQVQSIGINNSDIVFVGYGINAPEWNWNDYADQDVRGKTVVMLVNDPGYATGDPKLFNGKAMTYYGRWTYKLEEAARQGASAAIIIHETAAASYPWAVVTSSWTGGQVDIDYPDKGLSRVGVEGWMTADAAQQMFARAGYDFTVVKAAAARRGFKPIALGQTASIVLGNKIRTSKSRNVVGILPGAARPDEYFLYTAHWDHLGRCPADETGDDICNGALDNASGTAGLIALASAYGTQKKKPARSIMFVAFTAEESGLLGSQWFAQNPPVPLSKMAGGINMDGLSMFGRTENVVVIGNGKSELEPILARYAKKQKRTVEPEENPEAGSFYRSDHFPLAKVGVPMLYADGGSKLRGKTADVGKKLSEEYTAKRYHKPSDEFSDSMDFKSAAEDVALFYMIGSDVANSSSWPNWYPTAEFRAARDAVMAGGK